MATVTIAKSYFEALLRRGEFHTTGSADGLATTDAVPISQLEYAQLTKQSREYAILRNALLRGGLNESTLDLLISGAGTQTQNDAPLVGSTFNPTSTFARPAEGAVPVSITKLPLTPQHLTPHIPDPDPSEHVAPGTGFLSQYTTTRNPDARSYSFGAVDSTASYPDKDDGGGSSPENGGDGVNGNGKNGVPNQDQRTLLFTNLPERTTHAELTSLIKGGRLLDIYVRNDRTATVSFVEGAQDFLNYARKTDIYLRTKRLEVKWNDRQFRLPAHVANKLHTGATRNVVVRGGAGRELTEQGIRDDLEHIHNLVVISVKINAKSGDVFIETNSVHNALFARTCMMSRALYKGLKIEWFPDACAATVPKIQVKAPSATQERAPVKTQQRKGSNNLFALLAEDGADSDEEGSEEEEHEVHGYEGGSGVKINWADAAVVA